jgi:hypothetical protein
MRSFPPTGYPDAPSWAGLTSLVHRVGDELLDAPHMTRHAQGHGRCASGRSCNSPPPGPLASANCGCCSPMPRSVAPTPKPDGVGSDKPVRQTPFGSSPSDRPPATALPSSPARPTPSSCTAASDGAPRAPYAPGHTIAPVPPAIPVCAFLLPSPRPQNARSARRITGAARRC